MCERSLGSSKVLLLFFNDIALVVSSQRQAYGLMRAANESIETFVFKAKIKLGNRRGEMTLREAELWSAMAAARRRIAYPSAVLEETWKKLLLNQFHDILPGSSIRRTNEEAEALYDVELEWDILVSSLVCSQQTWDASPWRAAPFHANVEREGVARGRRTMRRGDSWRPCIGAAASRPRRCRWARSDCCRGPRGSVVSWSWGPCTRARAATKTRSSASSGSSTAPTPRISTTWSAAWSWPAA